MRDKRIKNKGKNKKLKITLITLIIIICTIGIVIGGFVYNKLSKINTNNINVKDSEIGIDSETKEKEKKRDVTSIALLGLDKEENATDVNMVLTLDDDNKEMRLLSILRDSYIYYGDDKTNKLNYAIHYGGPVNTIKVINQTYNTAIRDYILIDFNGISNVIDALGGIPMYLEPEEIKMMVSNKNLKVGNNVINGEEALSYIRIRHIDSDFKRTQRQRNVIQAIYNKMKSMSLGQANKFIDVALKNVETSLSYTEILSLGQKILSYGGKPLKEGRIPLDGTWRQGEEEIYYMKWDKEPNLKYVHDFIYGD